MQTIEDNMNYIKMTDSDRHFTLPLHCLVYDGQEKRNRSIVYASYVGIPEAVNAMSAGIIEGRTVYIGRDSYERQYDGFKRIQRPIGMGDVAHGMVYNSKLSLEGLVDKDENLAYLCAPDGNIEEVLSEHLIKRFGFPREWKSEYPRIFEKHLRSLEIIRNPSFTMWESIDFKALECSEEQALQLIQEALITKQLTIPESDIQGVFDPNMDLKEYMVKNAEFLAKKLEEMDPRHAFDRGVDPSIASMGRIPFPMQAHTIQAIVNTLDEEKVFCAADMGCGKSIISCGVAHVMNEQRKRVAKKHGLSVLLSAPGITLAKWKEKEIKQTLPYAKVEIIRNTTDALQFYQKIKNGHRPKAGEVEFTLIGLDRAKLENEKIFSGIWKREKGKVANAWHCPDCGEPLLMKNEAGDLVSADWEAAAEGFAPTEDVLFLARMNNELRKNGVPNGVKYKRINRILKCNAHLIREGNEEEIDSPVRRCESVLWRPAVKNRGECRQKPRIYIANLFKKLNKYFDLLVQDEVHQTKSDGSGRGDAFAKLVASAKRVLMLTGTLTNGKSTSIKEILWRTDARSLLEAGISNDTGTTEWAMRYGKLEKTVKVGGSGEEGVVTSRKRKGEQIRESSGIAPQLTSQFLLHKSVFMELPDLGLPIIPLKEYPTFIDMDPEHFQQYSSFHTRLYDACSIASHAGASGVWSRFNPATLMYADRPELDANIHIGEELIHAPALSIGNHAKERWLIETVQQELSEGRRVTIFNNFTGTYEMNEHIQNVLAKVGIRCEILDEPNTELRQVRLNELEEQKIPVIITNMKLVEVGLDMMYWPTIIFYQLSYEIATIRQSSRRAWRIGQERECRVYYPVYNGTQQMKQFLHIMHARGHSLMVEGRLDKSELAQFSRDSQSALASDLASCFATSDVADTWKVLADKELEGVEMVEESEFKAVLKQRMQALVQETFRLCGVDPADYQKQQETEVIVEDAIIVNEMSEDEVFNSLFTEEKMEQIFPNITIKRQREEKDRNSEQLSMDELFEIVSISEIKNTKKKRSKRIHEDQLCWNFG